MYKSPEDCARNLFFNYARNLFCSNLRLKRLETEWMRIETTTECVGVQGAYHWTITPLAEPIQFIQLYKSS